MVKYQPKVLVRLQLLKFYLKSRTFFILIFAKKDITIIVSIDRWLCEIIDI